MIVYRLTCIPTGKIYIGITRRSIHRRVTQHFSDAARHEWAESRWLFRAMARFQRSLWNVEVLARADSWAELLDLERVFIARYRANDPAIGYNRTAGGQGTVGMVCRPKTAAERAAVAAFHRGRKRSAETKELLRQNALRRWRENPGQFPPQVGDILRDAAIAKRYANASSYNEAGRDFGIGGPAAFHAVNRFLVVFKDWLIAASPSYQNVKLPKRIDPEWIEAMELSL